jgi:basic membrane lipoprotein Med (substrate-binding protein (PBP1-ABC) superfamily)
MPDAGRRRMLEVLGSHVAATQVEGVAPPDFDRVANQLARTGSRLIFTTSFSCFQPTLRVAQQVPKVMFESATGTSTATNVAIYNARFHEGRYVPRARAVIDGTWRPADTWGGPGSGMFNLAPFTNMTPEEVSEATRIRDALAAGTLHPFEGPITRQDGQPVIPAGQRLADDQIRAQNCF